MDSWPSHEVVAGFFVEFEAIRTLAACRRLRGRVDGVFTRQRRRDAVDAMPHRRAAQVNLGALNERWAKIEFLCDFYKGTDVPLLKFGEEDYEALENDQLTVQGMMASRYVAQFEKEVSMWSVSLLNVADVFTCDLGVPRCCGAFTSFKRLVAISRCREFEFE